MKDKKLKEKNYSAKTRFAVFAVSFIAGVGLIILTVAIVNFKDGGKDILNNGPLWIGIFGAITSLGGLFMHSRNKTKEIISKNYIPSKDKNRDKSDLPPGPEVTD